MIQVAKTEKTKAELYREDRKKRISSAAKKNSKKTRKHPNAGKIVGRIVGIVVAVAIVCGLCFVALDQAGVISRARTAFTVGEHKISVAEYGYMYYMQYQSLVNNAQESEQNNGYNYTGFDYLKAPADQDSSYTDDDGNPIRWDVQLKKQTESYMQEFYALYDNAKAEGYKLTDDEQKSIDENIENQRKSAAGDGSNNSVSMSLNAYLKANYGKGVSEGLLRSLMEKELVVQRFTEDKQKSFEDKYTDETLDKEYDEDPTEYNAVDLRFYKFDVDDATIADGASEKEIEAANKKVQDEAMKKANDLLADATDEASFKAAAEPYILEQEAVEEASTEELNADGTVADKEEAEEPAEDAEAADDAEAAEDAEDAEAAEAEEEDEDKHDSNTKAYGATKSSLSGVSEDAATWAMSAKKGAKKAFLTSDNSSVYALYVVRPAYKQETVDVRHILFLTVDTENGNAKLSDDEIKEKEAKKNEVWDQWNALADDEKTEDKFAELAEQYSEDPGSSSNGGLYEGVAQGQMVDSFNNWIFDDSRKAGDTDVIESEYGWHIMYYVGNKDYSYRKSLRTTHTQDDYSSWLSDEIAKDEYKITENASGMNAGYDRADRMIQATVKYLNSAASSSTASY